MTEQTRGDRGRDSLPHRRFFDVPPRRGVPGLPDHPGMTAEAQAAEFYLKHRAGPLQRSSSHASRFLAPGGGIEHAVYDDEATYRRIELALGEIPDRWWGCVLVSLGWGKGELGLQEEHPDDGGPPFLERAGFPFERPYDLSRYALRQHEQAFRVAIARVGLLGRRGEDERDTLTEELEPSPRAVTWEERMAAEGWVFGWEAIGEVLAVRAHTARRWARKRGLPVTQPGGPGGVVRARADELRAWMDARPSP